MMKTLYLIGGPMGVGKTAACTALLRRLKDSVFLDGDWCWNANPFTVTEETKAMVMDNITHLLNNFLHCSAYRHVIFCWVMHEQAIVDELLCRLDTAACHVRCISLVCSPQELEKRLRGDIEKGLRQEEIIRRSLERLPLYHSLMTEKIDTTYLTAEETAQQIGGA